MVPLFSLEEVSAGTTVFRAGNPGDKVYIVMHGNVEIRKGSKLLSTLRAEQGCGGSSELGLPVFGEMAMLDRKVRPPPPKATRSLLRHRRRRILRCAPALTAVRWLLSMSRSRAWRT